MVAIEKTKTSFNLPPVILEEFRRVAAPHGEKRQWMLITAALLLFLDAPDAVRATVVTKVAGADVGLGPADGYQDLIDKAKAGRLRAEAEMHLPNQGRPRKP